MAPRTSSRQVCGYSSTTPPSGPTASSRRRPSPSDATSRRRVDEHSQQQRDGAGKAPFIQGRNRMTRITQVLAVAAIATAFATATAWAQAPVRVRGTIEKVDGDLLAVKSREGTALNLKLKPDASVRGVVKA